MEMGDRPAGLTGFSSFLIIIVVTRGVLLDIAGTQYMFAQDQRMFAHPASLHTLVCMGDYAK